jgi:membrane associated rhomboid family serine protease
MSFSTQFRLGPLYTPRILKFLILITVILSILSAVTYKLFPHYFGWISLEQLLALSTWGIDRLFFWQLFSYLFVQPLVDGLSFSFFLSLAFNCYILWTIGASLIARRGVWHFLALYFLSGILSGILVTLLQHLTHSPTAFAGNGTSLYALLVAWACLFPHAEFLLLFAFSIRAAWLIFGFLGLNLLIDLSTGDWIRVIAYSFAALFAYVYSLIFWKRAESPPLYFRAKRYDFKTGRAILSDDEFLEAMLTKITLKGKKSLTLRERWRLRRISKKRK